MKLHPALELNALWVPLSTNVVKVNFDTILGGVELGVVVRDNNGVVLATGCQRNDVD